MRQHSPESGVPLDSIADGFLQLEGAFNVNAMQIVVVKGALVHKVLEPAIRHVIKRFPLLLSGPDQPEEAIERNRYLAGDIPVDEIVFQGNYSFQDPTFRQALTQWNTHHPIHWRREPPVRFALFRGNGEASAFIMCAHHAVADAHGDSKLVSAIMDAYCFLANNPSSSLNSEDEVFDFREVPARLPVGSSLSKRMTIGLRAMGNALTCLIRRDSGHGIFRSGSSAANRSLDFFHSTMEPELQTALVHVSRASGYSVNTILTACLIQSQIGSDTQQGTEGFFRLITAVSTRNRLGAPRPHEYRNFMVPSVVRIPTGQELVMTLAGTNQALTHLKQDGLWLELFKQKVMLKLLRWAPTRSFALNLVRRGYGTQVVYSNPGIISESFQSFGPGGHPITDYIGVGCVLPPSLMILYTPMVDGVIHLNGVFVREAIDDFDGLVITPLKNQLHALCQHYKVKLVTSPLPRHQHA